MKYRHVGQKCIGSNRYSIFEAVIMSLTPLGPLRASIQRLPRFLSPIASGFPSPAEDHIEVTLSLDDPCVATPPVTAERVMGVMDAINARWGRGTMRSAGVPVKPD